MSLAQYNARADVSLADLTHYGIGGMAQWYAEPETLSDVATLVTMAREKEYPVRIFGGGSNLLVGDGCLSGLTLRLDRSRFAGLQERANNCVLVGAAQTTAQLARWAAGRNWLEGVAIGGIPGSVGGALAMNAGTAEGSIADGLEAVLSLGSDGVPAIWTADECGFGYRESALQGRIVLGASFRFSRQGENVESQLSEWIRHKSSIQPYDKRSAGCMFRNPEGITAGQLIEELGFKGHREGGVEVSTKHANFLVNVDSGRCSDALSLMSAIREAALQQRGIELYDEIVYWPTM